MKGCHFESPKDICSTVTKVLHYLSAGDFVQWYQPWWKCWMHIESRQFSTSMVITFNRGYWVSPSCRISPPFQFSHPQLALLALCCQFIEVWYFTLWFTVTVDHYELVRHCLIALEECVLRFPQHYKSLYRLTHFYFHSKFHRNISKCQDLLLGTYKCLPMEGRSASASFQGLFADRRSSNFFNVSHLKMFYSVFQHCIVTRVRKFISI